MTGAVDLAWDDNSDVETEHRVFRGTTSGSLSQIDTAGSNTTVYSDTSVVDARTYYYEVAAANAAGESGHTVEISETVPLSAPSGLTISSGSGPVLNWTKNDDNPNGEWQIYRSSDGSSYTQIATTSPGTTSYTDSNATLGDKYWYYIRRSVNGFTKDTQTLIVAQEGGSLTATSTTDGTESTTVNESGSITAGRTISAAEDTTTAGSGSMTASATPDATESATVAGAGSFVIGSTPSATETSTVADAGSIVVNSSPSATETATASESGSFLVQSTASAASYSSSKRTTTVTGDGEAASSSELTDVFPTQSSVDLDFSLVNDPVLGFASEWVHEDSQFDRPTAFTVVHDMVEDKPFTIRIQYRESETGSADYTTDPEEVVRHDQPITFPELGDEGYYRLIVTDLRPRTYLRAITWGPVRY